MGEMAVRMWVTMVALAVVATRAASAAGVEGEGEAAAHGGTIGFSTLGRLSFGFDVYTVELPGGGDGGGRFRETRVTGGESVSYNAQLVKGGRGSAILERLLREVGREGQDGGLEETELLVYVSEVEGSAQLYLDLPMQGSEENDLSRTRRKRRFALRNVDVNTPSKAYLNDMPSMNGDIVVFVSTEEDVGKPLQGWNGVYSLNFKTSVTKRLTPPGITDYSPALSPSGEWVAVASNEGRGWEREIEALNLDLHVFKAEDGSQRRKIVNNAGWPSWADENTVYFHRVADDGWWSIFRVNVSDSSAEQEAERVTPPGVHAFTPAASRSGKWISVATRRTSIRHIELFDLQEQKFLPLTALINPNIHHYSPFVSPTSNRIGYHRCRGTEQSAQSVEPRVEFVKSPLASVSLVRIRGSFGVISPDGSLIAYVDSCKSTECLAVMNLDGSNKRILYRGNLFGTAWDPTGKGVVYVAHGPGFASVESTVRIVAIQKADTADEANVKYKHLTKEGTANNAFPSPSPDGKYVVFRSGRDGHKNLYIMDSVDGEEKYLRRLTEGAWIDTMPSWSPDNEWIAFSSNRLHPTGEKSFSLYLIRPNGTDLHLLFDTGIGGLANHPTFSPDAKKIAFTSDYAGVSAEPIAWPHAYQPYGEVFVINIDGSGLTRLTHNAYEDGTPTWGPLPSSKTDIVSTEGENPTCNFDDVWFLDKPTQTRRVQCPYMTATAQVAGYNYL
ncbi:hypothetical protein KC19_2G104400 [Ceratodon purpureus]|uniref:Uncharacterized protein n=1 Tax=Ceratodon purpureus TaxID=3225 RepID=A0A8T0ITZ2_CERPU|nr:hypothetical protein KC19_2G104400 [Ceratodon purpureus]